MSGNYCEVRYRVFSDGIVEVSLDMERADDVGALPEFGMLFTIDADFSQVRWYGLGPEETYAYSIGRKEDRALWIYGHCKEKWSGAKPH